MIIPPIGSLGSELTSAAAQGLTNSGATGGTGIAAAEGATQSTSAPNFGTALTEAVSSLETSQIKSDAASQALATGNVAQPEQAVSTVEDAALEMQLAAAIRTKATEAVQTIFQTQV